jgi:putative sterol carrier protein
VYQFNIGGKSWVVDLKNGNGSVSAGAGKADTTLTASEADFANLVSGKLDSQMAFLQGMCRLVFFGSSHDPNCVHSQASSRSLAAWAMR